jgi:transglutaminase-like putative cysteine protease
MHYSIRHLTKFRYSAPISESFMELRMQPRTEATQHCVWFDLSIKPRTRLTSYRDHLGNLIHHFDLPGHHSQLAIKSEAVVEIAPQTLPESLGAEAWDELDALVADGDYWEMLMPSRFASPTALLGKLARELDVRRRSDPLGLLRELTAGLHEAFEYAPQATKVDSPIDEALGNRRGVCQDFSHIMIALVRGVRIPCRYVSGYLFHRDEDQDRSAADATHAWVEASLPGLGWVGFDPTNNLIVSQRHIRVAIGRDYGDVPPTRGVFKGEAKSELSVSVSVVPSAAPPSQETLEPDAGWYASDSHTDNLSDYEQVQQQRRQQQQQQQQQQ